MPIRKALVLCALLLASAGAVAQDYYLGASIGKSDIDDSLAENLITSGSIDGKDSAFKLFAGGFFGKHLGAELAYVDLGELSYSGVFGTAPVTNGKVSIWGYNVAAVARFALTPQLAVFGKLGVFLYESEASDVTAGTPFSAKVRGWEGGSFGVGAVWRFTGSLAARAEWERFPMEDGDASLLSLGIQYNF
jgi:OmpA-OmpF porin, OOP family